MMNVIREERMNGHFLKQHLDDGRVRHIFTAPDGPHVDPHDHPWAFTSTIETGGYVEEVFDPTRPHDSPRVIERRPGDTFRNEAGTIHRIIRLLAPECRTIIEPDRMSASRGFYQFCADGVWHRFWDQRDFVPHQRG